LVVDALTPDRIHLHPVASTPSLEKPLREVVADHPREQIIGGVLRPGQRVREDEIASVHGVSRVPAREAIQRLANEGFLELVPYSGAVVASPSRDSSIEVMQIRRALESMAARLADRRGEPVARELARLVQRGVRASDIGAHAVLPDLVNQFHQLVVVASGNNKLIELLGQVRDQVRWMFAVDLHQRSAGSWTDHAQILRAILCGDADDAARLMEAHVVKDEQVFRHRFHTG